MFWIGLGVGLIVGGCIGFFVAAICVISGHCAKDEYDNYNTK